MNQKIEESDSPSSFISGSAAFLSAAKDCRVSFAFGVPGFPITDLAEMLFSDSDSSCSSDMSHSSDSFLKPGSGWFSNEKTAFEWGLGASFSGRRSLILVKHVGLNILLDSLMTAMTHTTGAGLVIVAGDDPEVLGSQNCQDSRYFGAVAGTAVFDPSNPRDIYNYVCQSFLLSEEIRAPVIIRITADVLNQTMNEKLVHARQEEFLSNLNPAGPANPKEEKTRLSPLYDKTIWNLKMRGKHQRFHLFNDPILQKLSEDHCFSDSESFHSGAPVKIKKISLPGKKIPASVLTAAPETIPSAASATIPVIPSKFTETLPVCPEIGIITSGQCFPEVFSTFEFQSSISFMKVGIVSPLPIQKIRKFLSEFSRVLVVEESEPVIEDQIRIFGNVLGKRTGHVPFGKIKPEDMIFAVENIFTDHVFKDIFLPARPPHSTAGAKKEFCQESIYPAFFDMLAEIKEKTHLSIVGDIGCSMYGAVPPYSVMDAAVSLGSSIGIGSGISTSLSKKTIAVIGDFSLSHSGILSLTEAVRKNVPLLIYVMQNNAAAMTGGQTAPDLEDQIRSIVHADKKSSCTSYFWPEKEQAAENKKKQFFDELKKISLEELEKEGISIILIKMSD
ncbi:thiamine pyrophosphate-dependent enzyme [Methanolapillus ohkumae]|uniref:Indolepyruvate oxidoreductase subunit IorA n=1 Tax=Methanolapillus ohkumae TaxID=3028298 RepID=A0AA96V7D0_9EURY|nr:hypothetical protein MsAm2_09960 [Methanosarcinaceae archaeon Am2]